MVNKSYHLYQHNTFASTPVLIYSEDSIQWSLKKEHICHEPHKKYLK